MAQWYDLRLETRESRVLGQWSRDYPIARMSPQYLRSPMLTFATKKLSTGANGQKEDAVSSFCRAVMALASMSDLADMRLPVVTVTSRDEFLVAVTVGPGPSFMPVAPVTFKFTVAAPLGHHDDS